MSTSKPLYRLPQRRPRPFGRHSEIFCRMKLTNQYIQALRRRCRKGDVTLQVAGYGFWREPDGNGNTPGPCWKLPDGASSALLPVPVLYALFWSFETIRSTPLEPNSSTPICNI